MTENKVTLITGASSGMGAALALEYAQRGHHLVLLARREERLLAVKHACEKASSGCRVEIVVGDVNEAVTHAVEKAERVFGRLDVVYANAGYAAFSPVEKLTLADYERQFSVNIFGVIRTYHASAEVLRRTEGRFAVVSSIASYMVPPGMTAYCMSKYAVRAFAEGLQADLKGKFPSVTLVCPGIVNTEIWQIDVEGVRHPDHAKKLPALLPDSPEQAATKMARAVEARRKQVVFPLHAKSAVFFARHFPRLLASMMATQPAPV